MYLHVSDNLLLTIEFTIKNSTHLVTTWIMYSIISNFLVNNILQFEMTKISRILGIFSKILEWILYFGLFLTSIYFAWEVLEKFNSQARGTRQHEESIQEHPMAWLFTFPRTNL